MHSPRAELYGLYAITDQALIPAHHFGASIEQALLGGAHIIQYRDKSGDTTRRMHDAQLIRQLCYEYDALFIINDDIKLASHCNADGVHLGKDDASVAEARAALGADSIVGVSCYDDFDRAVRAQQDGADYVAFGAFFTSPTKPAAVTADIDLVRRAVDQLSVPVCAIGGIDAGNAPVLIKAGADMIAVISSLFGAADIRLAATGFAGLF